MASTTKVTLVPIRQPKQEKGNRKMEISTKRYGKDASESSLSQQSLLNSFSVTLVHYLISRFHNP